MPMTGLHPTIWRKLRAKHGGTALDLKVYDRDNNYLGEIYLSRYDSCVNMMQTGIDFHSISWINTINNLEPWDYTRQPFIIPDEIPIGIDTFM